MLDGLGVESSEQAAANDTYSGRLTEEFVVEKLGHKFFDHVSELDLSSNKIRDTANCITGTTIGTGNTTIGTVADIGTNPTATDHFSDSLTTTFFAPNVDECQ